MPILRSWSGGRGSHHPSNARLAALTQADILTLPFSYWVGMNTDPRTTDEALANFNRFYSTTHVDEVVAAHAGFVGALRYELVSPTPTDASLPIPHWLAIYGM